MTLLTYSLFFAGICAGAIPLALHLLMRSKPQKTQLPTVRFIRQNYASNRRRFVIKQLLLLLSRVLLLVLLGLMLARPFLVPRQQFSGGQSGGVGRHQDDIPVAVAIVIDSSVRSGCQFENKTRLEQARQSALQILTTISGDSQIAILDGTGDSDSFQVDPLAAKEQIERIQISPAGRTVADSVLQGLALLRTSTIPIRELFVLTDCTKQGWSTSFRPLLEKELKRFAEQSENELSCCLIDVSQTIQPNYSVVDLRLSTEIASPATPIELNLTVQQTISPAESIPDVTKMVELILVDETGTEQRIDQKSVQFDPKSQTKNAGESLEKQSLTISFQLPALSEGVHGGLVRFIGGDPLEADNVRYFTIAVQTGRRIAIIANEPVGENSLFVREALSPIELQNRGEAPYETEIFSYKEWEERSLRSWNDYGVAFLLDPPPLSETAIRNLSNYAMQGGTIATFFGRRANPVSAFQTPESIALFGGKLIQQVRVSDWDVALQGPANGTAIATAVQNLLGNAMIPWNAMTVGKYWQMEPDDSLIRQLQYSDRRIALGSRIHGRGQVIVGTFPLNESQDNSWNRFAAGDASWVYLVLVDSIAQLALGTGQSRLNLLPGELFIHSASQELPEQILVKKPQEELILPPEDQKTIRFSGTNRIGFYRIVSTTDKETITAFCVNYPGESFDLDQWSESQMKELWSGVPLTVLKNIDNAEQRRSEQTGIKELFPFLILVLITLLVLEWILANRYYK